MQKNLFFEKFERYLLFLLIVNPFLDIFNGVFTYLLTLMTANTPFDQLGAALTPTLVVRMATLALMAVYILAKRDRRAVLILLAAGAAWVFSLAGQVLFIRGLIPVSLFTDAQYFARFAYTLCALLVFGRVLESRFETRESAVAALDGVFMWTLLILSLSILVCSFFGVGYTTYADRLGFRGSRGFFYAGNDVTAVMSLLLPLASCVFVSDGGGFKDKKKLIFRLSACAAAFTAMLVVGSTTAFVAAFASASSALLCGALQSIKSRSFAPAARFGLGALGVALLLFVLALPGWIDKDKQGIFESIQESLSVTEIKFDPDNKNVDLLSGRTVKLRRALEEFKAAAPFSLAFGIGRGAQEATIEMDFFEFFIYYGAFGAAAMLWYFAKEGALRMAGLFKKPSWPGFGLVVGLALTVGYGLIAGHVFFSVTSGFYLSVALVYGRLLFYRERKEL